VVSSTRLYIIDSFHYTLFANFLSIGLGETIIAQRFIGLAAVIAFIALPSIALAGEVEQLKAEIEILKIEIKILKLLKEKEI
jgi:hypothetical protein